MIVIEESDFKLEQVNESSNRWDLWFKKVVKHKNGTTDEAWDVSCYGVSLAHCIDKIINRRLANKQEVYSLKQFINDYRIMKSEIEKLCTL